MWYLPECEKVVTRAKGGLHGRHIDEDARHGKELKIWFERSGLPLRKFFNTSGLLYKSMQLREKLDGMSEEEQLELLASDGKLVKRPLVIGEDFVLVGFKPEEWEKVLLK